MPIKTPKKDNSFLYIISTITFILLGIILTSVIDQTKAKDVRARASAISGVNATAVVAEIRQDAGTLVVTQLAFASSPERTMGSWIVTPPSAFKLSSVAVGNTIRLIINPASLAIAEHSFTAKEIKK